MGISGISTGAVATASDVLFLGKSILLSASRTGTAASGDVAYTGAGFQPRTVVALADQTLRAGTIGFSVGFADQALTEHDVLVYDQVSSAESAVESYLVSLVDPASPSVSQKATLKTLDADGFTLNWDKSGAGAGGDLRFLCLG